MSNRKRLKQQSYRWLTSEQALLHDKAWKMVELIEAFVIDSKFNFLQVTALKMPDDTNPDDVLKYDHPLDFLIAKHPNDAQCIIFKQIAYGMVIDFCYFIQEALACAKRGRIVVAYSLLRRPLVYNLTILMRMMYDEGFYNKFLHDSSYDPTAYKSEDLQKMLAEFDKVKILSPINAAVIYGLIFDKNNPSSIINLSNRAIHPTTTRRWNMTGEMNFNFIFAVREDVSTLINVFYHNILAIIAYYFEIFNTLIMQYAPDDKIETIMRSQYKKLADCMS